MPIIETDSLAGSLWGKPVQQIYNGLDCLLTFEVFEELRTLHNEDPLLYNFERALQAPALDMMQRGFAVDELQRQSAIADVTARITKLDEVLQCMAKAVWDKPLNPRSHKQLLSFFYGAMRLPESWTSQKGQRKLSMNNETLEKLEVYFHSRPIIACIQAIREWKKVLETLQTQVRDGRMYYSINVAGTETGRFSSSTSAFGDGLNIQNLKKDPDGVDDESDFISIRRLFISDPGKKLCGIDLEQAESREVGWQLGVLFDDWRYLDACYAGDLHTYTCKLIWPKLGWTGNPKQDRLIADQKFYRHFSYRDMSKRGGHGCLTEDHEVLTPKGWVPIAEKPSVIMTWKNGVSFFDSVKQWTDYEYTGELCEFTGNSISLLATPDHRIPYLADQRNGRTKTRAAEDGPGTFMPLGEGWIGGDIDVPAKLIAAFMSDGHQHSTNRIVFHLKKQRKIDRLRALCSEYGYELDERTGDKYVIQGNLPKYPGAYMFHWTRTCLLDFVLEYRYWDGHQGPTKNVTLFSKHKETLEWIQTFGRVLGIGGQLQKPTITGYADTLGWRLQQNNRFYASGSSMSFNKIKVEHKRVLCPTVGSTWFYVRRKGKIHITGNSNYLGTPFTMARHLKVPKQLMDDFQAAYFQAFPLPRWHRWVAQELQTTQKLTTPFGRTRHFFGRPNEDTTLREAVAFVPQSATADRMNLALWRIWKHLPEAELLAQVHDAIYFQYPPELEATIIPTALALIDTPITHGSHTLSVPGEAKIGWNWGNYNEKLNPDGLRKWKPGEPDTRVRRTGLQRVF